MTPSALERAGAWAAVTASPHHFVDNFCHIFETGEPGAGVDLSRPGGRWIPFKLWPAQYHPLRLIHDHPQVAWLKARQIGFTWLGLAYALWTVIVREGSVVLLFSRRDTEAIDLLARLKGMFGRLPAWMQPPGSYKDSGDLRAASSHSWLLANGSKVMAFPTSAGDSYTATLAVVDEADLVPDLDRLLSSVKPTVDNGGKLLLISKSNKQTPASSFKNIYRAARAGKTGVKCCFLPWYARPGRTNAWYAEQRRESLARTFALDYLYGEYPNTDEEALAAASLDKRFPEEHMRAVYAPAQDLCAAGPTRPAAAWREWPCDDKGNPVPQRGWGPPKPTVRSVPAPAIRGLRVYRTPEEGRRYTAGCDPAQGLPTSNDSAIVVVDDATGEEVASLNGKIAPKALARYAAELSDWYSAPPDSRCRVMVERNNHGHAFLLWWESNRSEEHYKARLLKGPDNGYGWNQNATTKETMWHRASQRVSDHNERKTPRVTVHSWYLYQEILSIEAATLSAPDGGFLDDSAVAWGLALAGADLKPRAGAWELVESKGIAPGGDRD